MTNETTRLTTNVCCHDAANLTRTVVGPDKVTDTCRVCGCRHLRMHAEPGVLGVRFASPQHAAGAARW